MEARAAEDKAEDRDVGDKIVEETEELLTGRGWGASCALGIRDRREGIENKAIAVIEHSAEILASNEGFPVLCLVFTCRCLPSLFSHPTAQLLGASLKCLINLWD